MKSSIFAAAGLIAAAAAQWSGLPQCASICRGNMIGAEKSKELGCNTGDLACLCTNKNFVYGVRDCSRATCHDDADAAKALEIGIQVCKNAGVEITTSGSDASATKTGNGEVVSTIFSTVTKNGKAVKTAVATTTIGGPQTSGVSVNIKTSTETNGNVIRVTSVTTFGVTAGPSTASDASKTLTKTKSSKKSHAQKTTATGSDATKTATDKNASKTGSASASSSSTKSGNAGAQMTAAPAGVLAAAGLAALLL